MLRTARMVGPDLAKYYMLTGATITAQDAHALGMVAKLVAPSDVYPAIQELIAEGKPDKYREREIPEKFKPCAIACSQENIGRLFAGNPPEGIAEDLAARITKFIGFKAPLALKMGNEIIDQQVGKSMEEAIDIELGRLSDIFSTADALEGLSSLGRKRPEFKGA
jgi:enoyl-CoA hydratase/3-hydroxyacyl-CoA dehydrogenase